LLKNKENGKGISLMKTSRSLVLVVVLAIVAISACQAAAPALMCSRAALISESMKNVIGASIGIGGSGVAYNSASLNSMWFQKSTTDYDCTQLLKTVLDQELTFDVARPLDQVTLSVVFYDKDFRQAFWGFKSGYLDLNGGKYELPDSLTVVNMVMADIIGLPLSDPDTAQNVQINVRDKKTGQITMGEGLPVENGRVSLPTQYAGCRGELIIGRYLDGQYWQEWFDLTTGELIPQSQVATRISTLIEGYLNFGDNPWAISLRPEPQGDGTYKNPLVKFTITGQGIMVPMTGYLVNTDGNIVDTAYAVKYRKLGDSTWSEQSVEVTGGQIFLTLPAGTYQAFLRFKLMTESNPTPVNFWGDGKG
jgi:hypothetical protein